MDWYVYPHKDPSVFSNIRDIVDGKGRLVDETAMQVYNEQCTPQTSVSFAVYSKPELKE